MMDKLALLEKWQTLAGRRARHRAMRFENQKRQPTSARPSIKGQTK